MSRIQNILEKAQREGQMHRLRGTEPAIVAAGGGVLGGSTAVSPLEMPLPEPIVEPQPATRVVTGARLDGRLVTAVETPAAEQYRSLRTRILHADNGAPVNVVLVTSPGRGEGKTLTAGNLALVMGQEVQRRTCLVDADLRYPRIRQIFGLPDGPGLSDVLAGDATLDEALLAIEEYGITVLPAGRLRPHPAELLGTMATRRMFETLRSRFDRAIVDAPATLPLADIGILAPLVDSVLLVVRAGVTPKPVIHDAIAALDPSKLLGVLLNEAA